MYYDLPLADEKVKSHQVTSMHLISALAFIVSGAIICVYNDALRYEGVALLVAGMLLTGTTIFKNRWVIAPKNNIALRITELIISLTIGSYSVSQHWTFPIIIYGMLCVGLLAGIYLERPVRSMTMLHIDDEGIKLPMPARKRFINWREVEQVILKNGVLSINCVDNTFMQWNISKNDTDPEIFEAFCNAKIEENIAKRVADW